MKPGQRSIAIVTSTYYPDAADPIQQLRARLAGQTMSLTIELGYRVIIVDGGSDPSLFPLGELKNCVVTTNTSNVVTDRQLAASLALRFRETTHVAWTEPEKDITPFIAGWVNDATEHDAAVVLPMRTHLESYPLHQQVSERRGNEEIAECFGREMGDHYFGPRLFTRNAVTTHWLRDHAQYGTTARQWASIFSPVFGALAAGDCVIGVPVDYTYPPEQAEIEADDPSMRAKRRMQREVITQAARDIRDHLDWHPNWQLKLLNGYTLASQSMDVIDITEQQTSPVGA